jgi:hypothetical protein
MAMAKTTAYEEFYLEIDDGTGSNYSHYAGLMSKNFKLSASLADAEVPDADDESLPAVVVSGLKSVRETFEGTLTFIASDYDFYRAWMLKGDTRKVKVTIAKTQAQGGGHWTTPFVLNDFSMTSDMGSEAANASISLTSSGRSAAL